MFSQQFVQLGLSAAGGFLPLLQHLYISASKPALMDDQAKIDKRRSYYKHFQRAQKEDKHTLMAWMLRKALSLGFKAKYLLAEAVLLAYSKRWAVEVYFKEIKQTLGFLKEQSGHFTVCYASLHLTAIRYMLLLNLMLEKGTLKFGQLLDKASGQIELLSFAGMLWEVFKGLLSQTLHTTKIPSAEELLETLQAQFEEFLNQAIANG